MNRLSELLTFCEFVLGEGVERGDEHIEDTLIDLVGMVYKHIYGKFWYEDNNITDAFNSDLEEIMKGYDLTEV
ncbi:MAG: hypothetical protein ACRCZ0_08590 [Cetobacterium sp.]